MEIGKNKVVTLNYTLKNSDGMVLDTSEGREPLVYLQGVGALIPGLENELKGKEKGDKFDTVIAAKDAYGEKRDDLVQVVPKEGFQGDEELEIGMQVQVEKEGGAVIATVINIEGEEVTLDMNHMLAGMELHFNVEVMDIREASEEEISHGHVHGAGGHHH